MGYSLGMNLLTPSRLRAFRECQRLHHYRYVEGWRVVRTSEAMRVGSLVHLGLEAWWRTPVGYMSAALDAVKDRAIDPYEQAKVEEMLYAYNVRWSESRDFYEVLGVEVAGRAPLLNPATWKASRTWLLAGKVDLLLREKSTGRVLVCEHKTTTESVEDPTSPYWLRLSMDSQISAYTVLAEAMGHTVSGILYDVIRRPMLRMLEATPEDKRKYKVDGTLYANQRDRDETPEEYRGRIRDSMAESEHCFRRDVPRLESQIADFLFDAVANSQTMRESARLGRAPRNPDACHRFGQCSFWPVCSSGSTPADFPEDFIRSENVNPELEV